MNTEFFKMASEAAFTNPFSDDRVEIDRKIIGAPEGATWDEMQAPLFQALEKNISTLANARQIVAASASDKDAEAVAVSILFYVFYQVQKQFDALIEEQIAAGDEPCSAPVAFQCLETLKGYGFSHADACRYIGMFYQVRRAYYFISRGLVGGSACMKLLRRRLWDNIFTHDIRWYIRCLWNRMEDFSTLLLGETGTGKGAAAAAVGRSGFIPYSPSTKKFSESFTRAFVPINLSQYPEALIESELFGHRKGAFTGAVEKHDGVFSRCSPHGAIFLDEIGEVGQPIQIKLLQVLQQRTFSPVGSHEQVRFEGRVIAATNQSITGLRRAGTFRDDFYYRLCSDQITVPPLRQRLKEMPSELDMLIEHILKRMSGESWRDLQEPVMSVLKKDFGRGYGWPGNVRELEQAVRRILLTGSYEGDAIELPADRDTDLTAALSAGALTARELTAAYCKRLYARYGNYGEVARRADLDWRTVKKHVEG
ncbi:MAG: sigma 54-interacting transcriptional regulator [Pontiellaceae bacterium]|jgi:hypothetical protein|nr:sigma 54-interacting transcriptional regulator [Pontiellaceae bacterium]